MDSGSRRDRAGSDGPEVPPTDMTKMAIAGVLLVIPLVALFWVGSYARSGPELAGFPFFFWYQFVWVFITSALTWAAYKLTIAARPGRPPTSEHDVVDRGDGSGR